MMFPMADASTNTPGAISIRNVDKVHRQGVHQIQALNQVSLSAAAGEFVAIMGASGSGKSTLLHLCALLDKPDRGDIEIAGLSLATLTETQAVQFRRRTVGIIFQQFNLIPSLTVEENILLPARLARDCGKGTVEWAGELIERLGLLPRKRHRPDALSGGEQQRTAIARALVMRPPVILADEPTGNLDSVNAGHFWKLLATVLPSLRATVLLVTHEPTAAMQSQRVVVLRDGHVAGGFLIEEVQHAAGLAARYQELAR